MRLAAIRDTLTERDFDVVRTMRYRSELFGLPFSSALQRIMRLAQPVRVLNGLARRGRVVRAG